MFPLRGVSSELRNVFPVVFGKSPDSSSEVPKKQHRRKRYRKKSKGKCGEQLLAKPDSIGKSEPPGCLDISPDLSGLTESMGSSDFSGGPSGLLQPTVSSDEPINLATPAQPVGVAKQ